MHTPINAPIKSPIVKPIISTPHFINVFIYNTTAENKNALCCPCNINRLWIALIFTLSYCRYLSSMPCDKEHNKRLLHIAPLEFHHREDLPQPPSLVATSSEQITLGSPCFDKSRLGRSIAPPLPKKQSCFLGSPYMLDF